MRTPLVVALATAIALSITGSASAASRTAYFKVSLTASQDVTWTKRLTFPSCGGGTVHGGTVRRFNVTGHSRETVDTAKMVGLTGTFPITTKTSWTLTFRRLAHRPSGL